MKSSTSYVCAECGYDTPAYLGKCPECGTWNSLKEISVKNTNFTEKRGKISSNNYNTLPKKLSEIRFEKKDRFTTGFQEMDGVLGGGLVTGSVSLLAGDPGIGKSTILLQLALNISKQNKEVLYISGEESEQQIKLRADRLTKTKNNKLAVLSLTNSDAVVDVISQVKPKLVVIDSIQTMESENLSGLSGSVGQVRYAAMEFIKVAKSLNIPIILVGHVTKEGMVAGPMVLSHMVDTVLFLEGEKFTRVRLLRSLKNRFGPVDEVGVFNMDETGMSEVNNPEQIFLSIGKESASGSILTATLEGSRAFLVEIQALAVFSKFPIPRRVASGIDAKRLELLLAVLQKHSKLPAENMDIYVNVAGGMKLSDPAADLAICLAIYSSMKNVPVNDMVGVAEVGLLGELRPALEFEKRAKEAKKLGFKNILGTDKFKYLNQVISYIGK